MVAQKARSFVQVGPNGDPLDEQPSAGNVAVLEENQPNPNNSHPQPPPSQFLGPIQRTTTTVEKAQVMPTSFPSQPTVNGLVSTPAPQNVARGNLHYVPAENEHDEPQWPNMFRPYTDQMIRKLIDDIYRFNKYDFYQFSVAQSLPAGAATFSGELPQGPYEDVMEYLKSYAIQNGFPDAAFRIGVVLMPANKLVTSFILKFGAAKNILKGIEADQDPELIEKEKELKKVKIESQINAELKRNAPAPVEKEDPMRLVMTMQKQQSEQTNALVAALAPVVAALVSKPAPAPASNNNELLAMMMKMQNDSNKMMMDAQTRQTELLVKMMETNKKPEGGMDMFKMFEMMRAMKEDIREDFQAAQPRDDDDIEVDPKNITGSLLAHGIKGLVHLFRTGGPAVAAAVAQVAASAGKRPTELTDADEPAVRAALNIPPAPPQIAMEKPKTQQKPRPSNIVNMPAPKTLDELQRQTAQPVPIPALPETEEKKVLMQNDLEGELLLSLDTMIADIASGRIEREMPTWVEEACARWHKDFLDKLCNISAPVARMEEVKKIVGADAWSKVDVALAEANKGEGCHYQFYMSFDTLKEMWTMAKSPVKQEEEKKDVAQ